MVSDRLHRNGPQAHRGIWLTYQVSAAWCERQRAARLLQTGAEVSPRKRSESFEKGWSLGIDVHVGL